MKKKRVKKGFTLVELLAAIVVLAIIFIIAIPNIMKIISKSKIDSYDKQETMLKNAASKYVINNEESLTYDSNNRTEVPLSELIDNKYLSEPIIDPRTNEALDKNITTIIVQKFPGDTYVYTINSSITNNNQTLSLKANLKETATVGLMDKYIIHVQTSTTVDQILNNFNNTNNIKVFNTSDTQITGTTVVGTGYKIKLYDGDYVVDELTIIIYGDVSPSGTISISDQLAIKKIALNIGEYSIPERIAADINKDLRIDATDLTILKNHLLHIAYIVQ
jgi:prepilin-type N-terminal cleavage/methylation domain-containing protein